MRRIVLGLLVLVACGTAAAQPPPPGLPSPRVQHVAPLGVKAGASVEILLTGFDVEEPTGLLFAHPGLKGEFVPPPEPTPDPKDKKKAPPKTNPGGPHKFKITAAGNVPPGLYDLRLVGKWGVSNPRAFAVSDQTEAEEKEPNNDVPEAQKIELGTTVSGAIANQTDVDYFAFTGKKGQRVIVSCLASSIDSKASPLVEVYAGTRKLASNRNYRDNDALVDVVLPDDGEYHVRVCQFTYTAGGPDYFYRLSVSTAPWIDAVFPPVVEPGKAAQVTVYGRNLPDGKPADGFAADGRPLEKATVTINAPANTHALASTGRVDSVTALQDGFSYTLKGPGGTSNPVVVYFAREKLTVNSKSANAPDAAPLLNTPGEIAGFLATRGQRDWYAFTGKKGEKLVFDLAAERIGSDGDFFFSVRDSKDTKRDLTGEQDDDNDSLHPSGFFTRTSDPAPYTFTVPEDGKYYVTVGCREAGYLNGPKAAYRLRVAPAAPDFRAIVMPYGHYQTGSAVWRGGTEPYWVFAHRTDGYSGTIEVTCEGLPAGVTAQPLTLGPAARWGVLVLKVAPNAPPATATFKVKLTGTDTAGKKLTREARPASVTWGTNQPNPNAPVVARLDQQLVFAIRDQNAPFSIAADVPNATIKPANGKEAKAGGPLIVLKQGEKASVPVKVTWAIPEKQNVTLAAEPMAQNQQQQPLTAAFAGQPTKDKPEAVLNLDARTNAVPGTYSLVLRGTSQVPFLKDPMAKKGGNVPAEQFCPPVPVLIVPNALGKFTTGPVPNNTLKLGATVELPIKVDRMYDFAGEYKVTFALDKGATGVTATDATIAADKDETKLVLKVAGDAKPGGLNGVVTITATYAGKYPVVYENKVNFNLAK